MEGCSTAASWWPVHWIVVAGRLGEREKVGSGWRSISITWWSRLLLRGGRYTELRWLVVWERENLGSGRCSISITWWFEAFRSHWMVWPAVLDGGGRRLRGGGWEG
jgi:hypothetical protein